MNDQTAYRRILRQIPGWFLLLLLWGCEDPVDLDITPGEPRLVVISNFSDLDTLEVVVSRMNDALAVGPAEYVDDARVDIFLGPDYLETLPYFPVSDPVFPSFYRSKFLVPQVGEVYTIEVSAPGFETVRAVNAIPPVVTIDSSSLNLEITITPRDLTFNTVDFRIELRIDDPPEVENYYHLNFYQEGFDYKIDINGDTLREGFFSLPLAIEEESGDVPLVPYVDRRGVLLEDDHLSDPFDNLAFTGNFLYRSNDQLLGDFIIELRSVSREYYLYHTSLARQYQSNLDPFSDPVILFNNIENGMGIFAGFAARFYSLEATQ